MCVRKNCIVSVWRESGERGRKKERGIDREIGGGGGRRRKGERESHTKMFCICAT